LDRAKGFANLSSEELRILETGGLEIEQADRMIENAIGIIRIPIGIVERIVVNNRNYRVPMATEQKGIIAAVNKAAEWTLSKGGFKAFSTKSIMIGQIQIIGVTDLQKAKQQLFSHKNRILDLANTQSTTRRAIDIKVKTLKTPTGVMLIVELLVDVKDSMGANVVDSMVETVSPYIESLVGGKANLRIVSNLATKRMVHVETEIKKEVIGEDIVDRIVTACVFAETDPFRAATHNKGIMNGVSAVLLATGNDTRAVEAGAHAYASLSSRYLPLSTWQKTSGGDLKGCLRMPMAVGIVGGATSAHPIARIALKILGVKSAQELGQVAASVGLAYNLVALHALVTKGISRAQSI